jgi:hypothetical protein
MNPETKKYFKKFRKIEMEEKRGRKIKMLPSKYFFSV